MIALSVVQRLLRAFPNSLTNIQSDFAAEAQKPCINAEKHFGTTM